MIWRKVWRDLARNKARTLLAVLSIAVGVFALGVIYGAYDVISECLEEKYWTTIPVHVTFWAWPSDPAAADAVRRVPGVTEVEKQVDWYLSWKLEGEANWRDGTLIAREDYEAQCMGLIGLLDGNWPARRTLAAERQSLQSGRHVVLGNCSDERSGVFVIQVAEIEIVDAGMTTMFLHRDRSLELDVVETRGSMRRV